MKKLIFAAILAVLGSINIELVFAENLLLAPDAKLLESTLSKDELSIVKSLQDGNTTTVTRPVPGVIEYVIDFQTVITAERLDVYLGDLSDAGGVADVELLGSLASAESGFQLLRYGTVSSDKAQSTFGFLPTGARWLMVRITPSETGQAIPLAEIEVIGHYGEPKSEYAFQDSPVETQALLQRVRDLLDMDLQSEEEDLFSDAVDGQLDTWTLSEASLLASGVTDKGERTVYVKQLDQMIDQSANKFAGMENAMQRGEALLTWLHANALKGGYVEEQTDVSVLLDSGQYNCVSSALTYGILASKLDLDVRGIEVPDHALAILYDGTENADIETTTDAGFNPARNRQASKAFTERTGFAYIPASGANKRRETSVLGLVAFIYYNHGVVHSREGRYLDALRSYFRALSIDPKLISAVKNSLAALGSLSADLMEEKKYEEALTILTAGLTLAPEDRTLIHNRRVVWQQRISDAIESASIDKILALTQEAHESDPGAGFDRQQGDYFLHQGHVFLEQDDWQGALDTTIPGLTRVNDESLKTLKRFNLGVVLRWMEATIDNRNWEEASQALSRGLDLMPDEHRLHQNAAYLLQEWSEYEFDNNSAESAVSAVDAMLDRFSQIRPVQKAARNFVIRRVVNLREQDRLDEAVAAIAQYKHLMGDDHQSAKLLDSIYDEQVSEHIKRKAWAEALGIYEALTAGLAASAYRPRSYQNQVAYIAQEWMLETRQENGDIEPIARDLLNRFSDVRKLPMIVGAVYSEVIQEMQSKGSFETSAQYANTAYALMAGNPSAKNVIRYTYDRWAEHHRQSQAWEQAAEVYRLAMAIAPADSHLINNTEVAWHDWAKTHIDRSEWQAAIAVYQKGLQVLPNSRGFKKNIKYCEQQIAQ